MHVLAQSADSNAVGAIKVAVITLAAFVIYLLPTFVGVRRGAPNMGSVGVINLFLGWTVVGWVVALAMALRDVP